MANIRCAISGIRFTCSFLDDISIPHTQGYYHPVFAVSYTNLHHLYTRHCRGELNTRDSYLLFMAFIHSSEKVVWNTPATIDPTSDKTRALIENNIHQLITVLEKTALIRHPSFSQPMFSLNLQNSNLYEIPNWIKAWEQNIERFNQGAIADRYRDDLQKVENNLSKLILSGEKPENFSHIVANWASLAGCFPQEHNELWKRTIRSCFNSERMFKTPLVLIKEIKEFCESNIEVGSIHFHTLVHILKEGINRSYSTLSPTEK